MDFGADISVFGGESSPNSLADSFPPLSESALGGASPSESALEEMSAQVHAASPLEATSSTPPTDF